jgi:hypothetical protein
MKKDKKNGFAKLYKTNGVKLSTPALAGIMSGILIFCSGLFNAGLAAQPAVNKSIAAAVNNQLSEVGTTVSITLPINRVTLTSNAAGRAQWSVVQSPGAVAFSAPNNSTTQVAFLVAGTHILKLSLTNQGGQVSEVQTTVNVLPNPWTPSANSTALDYLRNISKPVFAEQHSLPPLGGMIQHYFPLARELADNWGFALQTGVNPNYCGNVVPNPDGSYNEQILHLAQSSQGRYKLIVGLSNILPGYGYPSSAWLADAQAGNIPPIPETVWMRGLGGNRLPNQNNPHFSPLAPEDWVRAQARRQAQCVQRLTNYYPASVVTSGGEYGVPVPGFSYCEIVMEPNILAAAGFPVTPTSDPRDPSCYQNPQYHNNARDYALTRLLSSKRYRHERIIREEIDQHARWVNGKPFYGLYQDSYGGERARWNGWASWAGYFEDGLAAGGISTVGNPEFYFKSGNSGFTGVNALGTPDDIMMKVLNDVGGRKRLGVPQSYVWLSAGWLDNQIAERTRWMGFMKAMMTTGSVGGLSGYFNYTDAYVRQVVQGDPVGQTIPVWLWQYTDFAQAQALFSHFDEFYKSGDLIAGSKTTPYNADPRDSPVFPLYALDIQGNVSNDGGPTAYVVARRLRKSGPLNIAERIKTRNQRWLITAWANFGSDRDVVANLPGAGSITLRARAAGSVYLVGYNANGQLVKRLLDEDPMNPTALLFP